LLPAALFAAKFALGGAVPSPAELARYFAMLAGTTLGLFWLALRINAKRSD
jgi:hypothetical protein